MSDSGGAGLAARPRRPGSRRRLAGINLKMYFGLDGTYRFLEALAGLWVDRQLEDVGLDLFVMPGFPALVHAVEALAGTRIEVGAQDLAVSSKGAQTGEVSGAMLAELGCRYVLVGHAERRACHHEDDDVIARKVDQAVGAGLTPVLCVGESDRLTADEAVEDCLRQIRRARLGSDIGYVIAYEPRWAIGAARPAPAEHVRRVCASLGDPAVTGLMRSRVLYGGAAGPGTFDALTPVVDGLFLGRFAHDPEQLSEIAQEIAGVHHMTPAGPTREGDPVS